MAHLKGEPKDYVRTRAEVRREARRGVGGRCGRQCRVRVWMLGVGEEGLR